jgi:signal transduction histidine kinase
MDGTVTIDETPGGGTTMVVTLPTAEARRGPGEASP